jgi:hypothetical protein
VGRLTANILGAKFSLMTQLPAANGRIYAVQNGSTTAEEINSCSRSSSASSSDMSEVKQQREVCLAQVKVFTKPSRCKV